jgi:hypothetical protein
MRSSPRTVVATLPAIVVALVVAGGSGAGSEDSDHDEHSHHFVRITDDRLTPQAIEMRYGAAIAWGNYTRKTARIRFARDVAKHIVCESPSSFVVTTEALESEPLRALQFASLCKLSPGEYAYEVMLTSVSKERIRPRPLKGRIVVAE